MAPFNFDGSCENIGDGVLDFIYKVIKEQDIKVQKITLKPVGKPGDNFAANVKRVVVEGEDRSFQLIAKLAPQNENARKLVKITEVSMNEHIMYTEFLPKIEQLQKEAEVPKADRLRYAKCYGSLTDYLKEVILLEDLALSDFSILDKFVSLNNICVKSVLKNMAILHSFSYILKSREPETFNSLKSRLSDIWYLLSKEDNMKVVAEQFQNNILSAFEEDIDVKNKIQSNFENLFTNTVDLAEFEYNNKHSVILQADPWTNNFMFRFEEEQLLESIMIDYQLSKNGNPVNDIMALIFNCTDYESRSKHYFEWLDFYHAELDKSLSYFNLSAKSVYPRSEMDADIKRYAQFLFAQSCIACVIAMRTGAEAVEMVDAMQNSSDYSELVNSVKTDTLKDKSLAFMKGKIMNILTSFEELGIFSD